MATRTGRERERQTEKDSENGQLPPHLLCSRRGREAKGEINMEKYGMNSPSTLLC